MFVHFESVMLRLFYAIKDLCKYCALKWTSLFFMISIEPNQKMKTFNASFKWL